MLRMIVNGAVRSLRCASLQLQNGLRSTQIPPLVVNNLLHHRQIHNSLFKFPICPLNALTKPKSLLNDPRVTSMGNTLIARPMIKFSLQRGKRKTVKPVLKRFYRLDWGGWIRTKTGRHKHLWKKTAARKRRLRQHVFVNSTQATLLDKMVSKYWRKPKYYVDDPYEPYHTRDEFLITRKTPL